MKLVVALLAGVLIFMFIFTPKVRAATTTTNSTVTVTIQIRPPASAKYAQTDSTFAISIHQTAGYVYGLMTITSSVPATNTYNFSSIISSGVT